MLWPGWSWFFLLFSIPTVFCPNLLRLFQVRQQQLVSLSLSYCMVYFSCNHITYTCHSISDSFRVLHSCVSWYYHHDFIFSFTFGFFQSISGSLPVRAVIICIQWIDALPEPLGGIYSVPFIVLSLEYTQIHIVSFLHFKLSVIARYFVNVFICPFLILPSALTIMSIVN